MGKEWPPRNTIKPGGKNIVNDSLVDRKNIILPPLRIKLGVMKHFVKAFNCSGDYFEYSCSTFPGFNYEKKKAEIFDGPQIKMLLRNQHFVATMTLSLRLELRRHFLKWFITSLAIRKLVIM